MSRRESAPALGVLYCPTCEREWTSGELCPNDGTRLVRIAGDKDMMIGRVLDNRFTIEDKLGAGGMGSVYRARQHSVGRPVAIKVVNPGLVADANTTKRFLREAKLASRLSHPNVVAVLDFGQTADGLFYLVMELVHGRTLHAVMVDGGRMAADRVVRIGSQICDALEGAHAIPIMHRDLKPANIMLLSAGRDLVKVLDFGLAKSLAVDASSNTMTSAGALLGTPTFMPPEVAMGQPVDERADLYSLGCILYFLIAGRPPFVTDSVPEMIAMHGTEPAPRLTNTPAALADVIDRLLQKDPDARYPSAEATRAALESALDSARSGAAHADTFDEALPDEPPLVAPTRPTEPSMIGGARAATPATPATSDRRTPLPLPPPLSSFEDSRTTRRAAVAAAPEPSIAVAQSGGAPVVGAQVSLTSAPAFHLDAQPSTTLNVLPRRRGGIWVTAATVIAVVAIGVYALSGSNKTKPTADAAAPAPAASPSSADAAVTIAIDAGAPPADAGAPPADASAPRPADAGAAAVTRDAAPDVPRHRPDGGHTIVRPPIEPIHVDASVRPTPVDAAPPPPF